MTTFNNRIASVFEDGVTKIDLDYGNSGYRGLDGLGVFKAYIEAPNHTLLEIYPEFDLTYDGEDYTYDYIKKEIREAIEIAIDEFDPVETFKRELESGNIYDTSVFAENLKEDKIFFEKVKEEIINSENENK